MFNQMQARLKQQIAERNRFLAAVSHDLRTPLTRLKLRAEKIGTQNLKSDIRGDIDEMTAMIDAAPDYLRGDGQPEFPFMMPDKASLKINWKPFLRHSIASMRLAAGILAGWVSGFQLPVTSPRNMGEASP